MKKIVALLILVILILAVSLPVFSSSGSVSGGGKLLETSNLLKKDWHKISFGGWSERTDAGYVGEWQVNFHNVGNDAFDKSKFHGTDIRQITFFNGDSPTCDSAMNLTVYGYWNHQPGYKMVLRAGDAGSPGYKDTVRVELYAPGGGLVYDTHAGDFADESSCVGSVRTGLDSGNVAITLP